MSFTKFLRTPFFVKYQAEKNPIFMFPLLVSWLGYWQKFQGNTTNKFKPFQKGPAYNFLFLRLCGKNNK